MTHNNNIYSLVRRVLKTLSVAHFKIKLKGNVDAKVGSRVYIAKCQCFTNGGGNGIIIEEGTSLRNCRFFFKGNNNKVIIHSCCHLQGATFWFEDDNNLIEIGKGTTTEGHCQFAACEECRIVVGSDCMFSHEIHLRTTDSHAIKNEQGLRINKAKEIYIGNHVWIGMQCLILKGSKVGDGSVCAARSTITSSSSNKNNIILSGTPAREIKEHISWYRSRE